MFDERKIEIYKIEPATEAMKCSADLPPDIVKDISLFRSSLA